MTRFRSGRMAGGRLSAGRLLAGVRARVKRFEYTGGFDGTTLRLGDLEFTSAGVAIPAGDDIMMSGGGYFTGFSDVIADAAKDGGLAIHVPATTPANGTYCYFSADDDTNTDNGLQTFDVSGRQRLQVDGNVGAAAQNKQSAAVVLTAGEKHLRTWVLHANASGDGFAVTLYLDGVPVLDASDVLNIPQVIDRLTLFAKRGATVANYLVGTVHPGLTIQPLKSDTMAGQLGEARREVKRILRTYMPDKLLGAVGIVGFGQSKELGVAAGQTHPAPISLAPGTMYGVDVSNAFNQGLVEDMTGIASGSAGVARTGVFSPMWGRAKALFDLYGLRSVTAMAAVTGTKMLEASPPAVPHWQMDGTAANGLLTADTALATSDPDAPAQSALIDHIMAAFDARPQLDLQDIMAVMWQMDADLATLSDDPASPTYHGKYTAALQGVWDYLKSKGFTLIMVQPALNVGIDAAEVAANAADVARIRAAQQAFIDANDDAWLATAFDPDAAANGAGTLNAFDTTVDGGVALGRSFYDKRHPDGLFGDAVGVSMAVQYGDVIRGLPRI